SLEKYKKEIINREDTKYTLEDHSEYLHGEISDLFNLIRRRILNLDPGVKEVILKKYIAYKTSTNFVDIKFQKERLLLIINLEFAEINDPRGFARDVTGVGHRGNGDIEVGFSNVSDLDYVMSLVQQSYAKFRDEV
ncbi:MAG TPA: DUF5655 domain-containing protein, partial [Xanthomonadales bacterium]|nr:DUF5655 domain-containing protein [Xanthomonadales bacterium]